MTLCVKSFHTRYIVRYISALLRLIRSDNNLVHIERLSYSPSAERSSQISIQVLSTSGRFRSQAFGHRVYYMDTNKERGDNKRECVKMLGQVA